MSRSTAREHAIKAASPARSRRVPGGQLTRVLWSVTATGRPARRRPRTMPRRARCTCATSLPKRTSARRSADPLFARRVPRGAASAERCGAPSANSRVRTPQRAQTARQLDRDALAAALLQAGDDLGDAQAVVVEHVQRREMDRARAARRGGVTKRRGEIEGSGDGADQRVVQERRHERRQRLGSELAASGRIRARPRHGVAGRRTPRAHGPERQQRPAGGARRRHADLAAREPAARTQQQHRPLRSKLLHWLEPKESQRA